MGLLLRREVCIDLCGFDEPDTEMGLELRLNDEISQGQQHADWERNRGQQWRRSQQRLRKRGAFQGQKRVVLLKFEIGESFQGK